MSFNRSSMRPNLLVLITIAFLHQTVSAAEELVFECKRTEKDFTEEYEMKLVPVSKSSKAKIFLDGKDLDKSDSNGTQVVKSIQLVPPQVVILIGARFEPESLNGVSYSAGTVSTLLSAGTVSTLLTLNQSTGKLKKVETIRGGILGSNLGDGTRY